MWKNGWGRHSEWNSNNYPWTWTPRRGSGGDTGTDWRYHTSDFQNQQSQSDMWYSIIPEEFKINVFEEKPNHFMVEFDGDLRNRCHSLQSNIDEGIYQYRQEQKLLARIADAKRRHQIQQEHESRPISRRILARNPNVAEETVETRSITVEQLKIHVKELEDRLMLLRLSRISYLSRMYEMKATTADAISRAVKICGFVMTEENIYEILFALVREKILPEGKQFIINYFYYTPRELVEIVLNGINALGSDKQICELISFEREDHTASVLENFAKGALMGIFLPLDRGFLGNESVSAMANTEYMINFFTMQIPLIENSTLREDRVKDYWKRVDYSKHVKGNHRPLTVVDFVQPSHIFQYKDMYRQKGFVVDLVTVHNFEANFAQIQPPLVEVFRQSLKTNSEVTETVTVTSEAVPTKSQVQSVSVEPAVFKPITKTSEDKVPVHQNRSETPKIAVCKPFPVIAGVKIPIQQSESDATQTVFSQPNTIPVNGKVEIPVRQKSEASKDVLAKPIPIKIHLQQNEPVNPIIALSKPIPVISEMKIQVQQKSEAPKAISSKPVTVIGKMKIGVQQNKSEISKTSFSNPIPVISNMRTSPTQPKNLTSMDNPLKRRNVEVENHMLNGQAPVSKENVQTLFEENETDGPLLEVSFFRDYGHTYSDYESSVTTTITNNKRTRPNIPEDQASNSNSNGSASANVSKEIPRQDFQDPLYYSFNSSLTDLYPDEGSSPRSRLLSAHRTNESQNSCFSTNNDFDLCFERRQR